MMPLLRYARPLSIRMLVALTFALSVEAAVIPVLSTVSEP